MPLRCLVDDILNDRDASMTEALDKHLDILASEAKGQLPNGASTMDFALWV